MPIQPTNGDRSVRSRGPSRGPSPGPADQAGPPDERAGGAACPRTIRVRHGDVHSEDVTAVDGIPVTTPARTLLDPATVSGDRELEHALGEALRRNLTDRSEILAVIARYPHHLGGRRLAALLGNGARRRGP